MPGRPDGPSPARRSRPGSTEAEVRKIPAAPFHPSRCGPWSNSERSSAAEPELLHDVVLALRDRDRIVEPQRSERRGPDQADTDRATDRVGVVIDHGAPTGTAVDKAVDFAGRRPTGRTLIVP